jgi:hypothetical protein
MKQLILRHPRSIRFPVNLDDRLVGDAQTLNLSVEKLMETAFRFYHSEFFASKQVTNSAAEEGRE